MNVYLSTYHKIFRRLSEMLFTNLMLINFCLLRSVGHRIGVKRGLSGTLWILIPVLIKAEAIWSQQLKPWSNLFCECWDSPGCHQWGLQSSPQGLHRARGDSGGDHLADFGGCFARALLQVLEEVSCSRLASSRALVLCIRGHFVVLQILVKAVVKLLSS